MSALRLLPTRCRCGAGGFLEAVPVGPSGGADAPPQPWGFVREADAQPVQPPAREWRVAIHESAHAVIAHALGRPIASITIEGQPHAAHGDAPTDHMAAAMIALAGDHAERLILRRLEFRPYDADVLATFNAVRELRFGACDRCQIAFSVFGLCGSAAPDDLLLSAYRTVEAATIALIREPLTQAAIRDLADALMREGEIVGAEAHKILNKAGVEFGSRRKLERKS